MTSIYRSFNLRVTSKARFFSVIRFLSTSRKLEVTSERIRPTFKGAEVSLNNETFHIPKEEFAKRRLNLAAKVANFSTTYAKKENIHYIIIPSGQKKFMVDKIPYFFRQATDFRYFTGSLGPDSILVLRVECNEAAGSDDNFRLSSSLFLPDSNAREEKWEGPRIRPEEGTQIFGVDESHKMSDFQSFLNRCQLEERSFKIWYDYFNPSHLETHRTIMEYVQQSPKLSKQFVESPRKLIHELRVIKSDNEINLMRKTCEIGAKAIKNTIRATQRLESEAQAFATVDYHCRMEGASYLAYPPVVAYGVNANTIHYIKNSQDFGDRSQLILMDAGCEYEGYASDITRVWPIHGRFTTEQKLVYEAVLDIQTELLSYLKSSAEPVTVDSLYRHMQQLLGCKLLELGLVDQNIKEDELRVACSDYCPHHVSHYLGMDIHDTVTISRDIPLKPGMVITIEPGIYISKSNRFLPSTAGNFSDIGVRIEDDILITLNEQQELSFETLSNDCPKSVSEIEQLCVG